MKQTLFITIFLTIMFTVFGCSRDYDSDDDTISLMAIESHHIYVAETENPTVYAVSAKVIGILADGCEGHHETIYDEPRSMYYSDQPPSTNYSDGDTVTIEIKMSEYMGPDDCHDAVHYYIPVLFLGYFEKGSYTLVINGDSENFTVG